MLRRRALPLLVVLLSSRDALAFCRTSTASTPTFDGHVCTPAQESDKGLPIFWPHPRVTYALQQDASAQVDLTVARDLVRRAFLTWTGASCGVAGPRIQLFEVEPVPCARHEYNQDRGNANIIMFRDQTWAGSPNDLALTTVSFTVDQGEIFDADMEVNTALFHFTTSDVEAEVTFDLLSVLTHETGHFLGLAHAPDPEATMYFAAPATDRLKQRTLTDDDRAGICAVYPPSPIFEPCAATPRHGSSPLCAADQPGPAPDAPDSAAPRCCCPQGAACVEGGCALVPASSGGGCALVAGGPSSSGPALELAALLALALGTGRRGPTPTARPRGHFRLKRRGGPPFSSGERSPREGAPPCSDRQTPATTPPIGPLPSGRATTTRASSPSTR